MCCSSRSRGGSRWTAAFGSLLLFMFVLQVVTGILLTTCYAPSVGTAWQSVKYIQEEAPLGWFIRGMHHWGSSAMVILLLFHLVQVFVWGAYKRPRELTWMTGVLLLGATLGSHLPATCCRGMKRRTGRARSGWGSSAPFR